MTSTPDSPRPLPVWRFWLPLLLQTALITSIPAQAVYIHLTGRTAIIQTAPVDPYDFLRGYSQTLSYEISRENNLEKLPGWKNLVKERKDDQISNIYVILEAPAQKANSSGRPDPWKPIAVSGTRPSNLPANRVAIKGQMRYGQVTYGLETYYFPEDQREQINQDIGQAQSSQERQQGKSIPFVVEVKVDAQGNAVPVSLWVRDRNYRF